MGKNEDYLKGMKLLVNRTKGVINIHKYPWVIGLSDILSAYGLCYKFWYNVCNQDKIRRIPLCETVEDIMYGIGKCLFTWDMTDEGGSFWCDCLHRIFYDEEKLSDLGRVPYV